jgi:predicted metalloendopeptidase
MPDRHKEAVAVTNGALGQAVGQLYTQRYFPPQVKVRAQAMVSDLINAYRGRIANLTWMLPLTKQRALAKLAALQVIVGYPDVWTDYSSLDIVHGDAFGNMRRAEAFYRLRNLAKLKQPVNPIEWPINPQVPGAVIMFSPNAEFFSAAILQPPYFDGEGDSASNYGSAGAGMAHEISHSFDELGNIYERARPPWSLVDGGRSRPATERKARSSRRPNSTVTARFPTFASMAKQVLSENIADLAGLLVAHDAYVLSLKGKSDVVIGGLSGEQRFFSVVRNRDGGNSRPKLRCDSNSEPTRTRRENIEVIRCAMSKGWYAAYKAVTRDHLISQA